MPNTSRPSASNRMSSEVESMPPLRQMTARFGLVIFETEECWLGVHSLALATFRGYLFKCCLDIELGWILAGSNCLNASSSPSEMSGKSAGHLQSNAGRGKPISGGQKCSCRVWRPVACRRGLGDIHELIKPIPYRWDGF